MRDLRSLEQLVDRFRYLNDKRLSDLSIDEVEEYLELSRYFVDLYEEIKSQVEIMWGKIKNYLEDSK